MIGILNKTFLVWIALQLISQSVSAQEVTLPYVQTFDDATTGSPGMLPANWQQVIEGTSVTCGHGNTNCHQWGVRTGTTNSSNTGPVGDHTTGSGNYVYVEASGNTNPVVELLSPSFDLAGDNSAFLTFWTHSYNGSNATSHDLNIDIVNAANTVTLGNDLVTIADTDFNNWRQYTLDLSAYSGSGIIRVKFQWEEDDAEHRLDHGVDDFQITSDYCSDGNNYREEFASANYDNSNGSIDWSSSPWVEADDDGNPATGEIRIVSNRLEMNNSVGFGTPPAGDFPSLTRSVDLSAATFASLSFDYSEAGNMESSDEFEVRVYDGTTWHTVYSMFDDYGSTDQTAYIDITEYANANTQIRFIITAFHGGGDEIVRIKDVEICFIGDALSNVTTDFTLEAECGYIGSSWSIFEDDDASNDTYVEARVGLNSLASAPADTLDYLTYTIEVDTAGDYEMFARIIAPNSDDDSFWIRANGGTWLRWDGLSTNASWAWLQVYDSDNVNTNISWTLPIGTSRFDIAYREDGTLLDKIYITIDGSLPSGLGDDAINCPALFGLDTDGDGIVDDVDLDDDNDGLPDIVESPATIDFSNNKTSLVGSDLTDMEVNDVALYEDAVRDCNDILYDITITINSISPGVTVEAGVQGMEIDNAGADDDDYFTFTLSVVESGSATVLNPTGTAATITDFLFTPRDIDSNDGVDHTEVFGISNTTAPDATFLDDGTVLEAGGFVNGGGPGAAAYAYYRMIPLSGPTDWTANGNDVTGELVEHAVFMFYENFSSVDIAYGRTGSAPSNSSGNRLTSLFASKECDRDDDGVPNRIDLDLDNDGIFDLHEAGHSELDINDDGRIDLADVNSGSNGIFDDIETTPESGIINYTYSDSDGDGIEDPFDRDSDEDGCFDTQESDNTDPDNDGIAGSGTPGIDKNGLVVIIVYDMPPSNAWQDSLQSCLEICDNGLDDDGDGDIDENDTDCANYYLEAECGFPGDNWNRGFDVLASNDDYLTISTGLNSTAVAPSDAADLVRFTLNVTAAGLYRILGRVYSLDGGDDSFWVRVDEGTWYPWNDWNTASTWQWIPFSDNSDGNTLLKFNLTPGNHTIDIAYREDGARIDKLHLTVNGTTPIGDGEDAINCGRTITYNLFLPFKILNK